MSLGIMVKINVKPGRGKEFERIFKDMQAGVHTHEKGKGLQYDIFVSRENPDVYWVVEQFADDNVFEAHCQAPYFLSGYAAMQDVIEGAPEAAMCNKINY